MRRRLTWTAIGFAVGYLGLYALFLADALSTPHFEALYETTRPQDVLAWLRFQHRDEAAFLAAGLLGAILGFVASFARRRRGAAARAT